MTSTGSKMDTRTESMTNTGSKMDTRMESMTNTGSKMDTRTEYTTSTGSKMDTRMEFMTNTGSRWIQGRIMGLKVFGSMRMILNDPLACNPGVNRKEVII